MLKKYKAIFFDWDGTAVMSRRAPVDQAVAAMRPLLQKGIKLIIVSGTTIENIAGGKIESYFAEEELKNLYLGLGRGAYNYSFKDGIPYIFKNMVPDKGEILKIHQICFEIHHTLKEKYDLVIIDEDNSDLDIFDFLDYCKEKGLKKIVISSENIEDVDYLKKQFMKNELMNKILTYLGK